jgi:hypothetical protein
MRIISGFYRLACFTIFGLAGATACSETNESMTASPQQLRQQSSIQCQPGVDARGLYVRRTAYPNGMCLVTAQRGSDGTVVESAFETQCGHCKPATEAACQLAKNTFVFANENDAASGGKSGKSLFQSRGAYVLILDRKSGPDNNTYLSVYNPAWQNGRQYVVGGGSCVPKEDQNIKCTKAKDRPVECSTGPNNVWTYQ